MGIAKQIYAAAEVGYSEVRTARPVSDRLQAPGVQPHEGLALTGVRAVLEGDAGPGPTVAVLRELNSLTIREHPD